MPNTARQNFIVKVKQCFNLLKTVDKYLKKISYHCIGTEYFDVARLLERYNQLLKNEVEMFLKSVRGW